MIRALFLLLFLFSAAASAKPDLFWFDDFAWDWKAHWILKNGTTSWGAGQGNLCPGTNNTQIVDEKGGKIEHFMRIKYPAGSYTPNHCPMGGASWWGRPIAPRNTASLSYWVRFGGPSSDFDFVWTGKLPGLCGGTCPQGGIVPDGSDGWSTRFGWITTNEDPIPGALEIYGGIYDRRDWPYNWEVPLGRGSYHFIPGRWTKIEQEIVLNGFAADGTPLKNGILAIYVDGVRVWMAKDIGFRTTPDLKIDTVVFVTAFGGDVPSNATPIDQYVDFANFELRNSHF